MPVISSREEPKRVVTLLDVLDEAEIEFLAAILFTTALGQNGAYGAAVMSLLEKVQDTSYVDFIPDAAEKVGLEIHKLDNYGNTIDVIKNDQFMIVA